METRLHINLSEGIIEAEGGHKFVQRVYDDFKDQLQEIVKGGKKPKPPKHHEHDEDEDPGEEGEDMEPRGHKQPKHKK